MGVNLSQEQILLFQRPCKPILEKLKSFLERGSMFGYFFFMKGENFCDGGVPIYLNYLSKKIYQIVC